MCCRNDVRHTEHSRHRKCQIKLFTLRRYLSSISKPQLAHTFFPVEGTEETVDVGEQMEGVDGGLGEERVSSLSIVDRWDSPSE